MKTLGNILWILFGGGIISLCWLFAGMIWCCTIIGIPIGVQCFKFAGFVLWPFGKDIRFSNRCASFCLNVIWIMLFGWELTLFSCFLGIIWCITIVGIPFGSQCFKFARLSLMPFGAQIV